MVDYNEGGYGDETYGTNSTVVNVTDYGAAGDGTTDDTQAIRDAADAAGAGGTVYFPAGTYLVGSNSQYPLDYPMDGSWDNLTWKGENWDTTALLMAGGHTSWHMMFRTRSDGGHQTDSVTFDNLEIDMNKSNNPDAPGSHFFRLYDAIGTFTISDCIVRNSITGGVIINDDMDGSFRYCDFISIGDPARSAGHPINPNPDSAQTYDVYRCYFEDPAGTSIDTGTDDTANDWVTANVDECFFRGGIGSIKMSTETADMNVRNCYFTGNSRTTRTIKSNTNASGNCGTLLVDNCYIEDDTASGIDLAAADGHSLVEINQTALYNVATDGIRDFADGNGKAVTIYDSDIDSTHFSCHNVGPNNDGAAVFFDPDATGSVDKVSHDNTSGLGTTNNVTVGTNNVGGAAISPNTVSESETGPRSAVIVNGSISMEVQTSMAMSESITSTFGGSGALGNSLGGPIGTKVSEDVVSDTGSITSASVSTLQSRESASVYTGIIYDSFEDGDISEYSTDAADKSRYSVVDEANVTPNAIDGTKMLKIDGTNDTDRLYSKPGDGLDNYYSKGDGTLVFYHYHDGTSWDGDMRFLFSYTDTSHYYDVTFQNGDDLSLNVANDNGYSTLASALTDNVQATQEWYRFEILWSDGSDGNSDGYIEVSMYTKDGTTALQTISATDTSLNASGFAWRSYGSADDTYWDYASGGDEDAIVDSGLVTESKAEPLVGTVTTQVSDTGNVTASNSSIIEANTTGVAIDSGQPVAATASTIQATDGAGAFESMSITDSPSPNLNEFGEVNESMHLLTNTGEYGDDYGNVYSGNIERIVGMTETAIAQEPVSMTASTLMSETGDALAAESASVLASSSTNMDELNIGISSMSLLRGATSSMNEYAWAYESMSVDSAPTKSILDGAFATESPSIDVIADIGITESALVRESIHTDASIEMSLAEFAPVHADFDTLKRSPSYNIDDLAIANETMLLETTGYGINYGDDYSGGTIARITGINDTAIADAYLTMRTPKADMSLSELSVILESPSISNSITAKIAELAIAREAGSVSAKTVQEIDETIFEEIVNEAMSMGVDSDVNLYHAITLYHTVTGNSPSQVEYPKNNVRYEE